MRKRKLMWFGVGLILMLLMVAFLIACAGPEGPSGPAGPAGPAGEAAMSGECADCHNDTTEISAKQAQIALTTHVTGRGWHYAGPRAACSACHSSQGFIDMVANGSGVEDGKDIPNASPPDCRTCHQIHETYTEADYALKTTEPVTLIAGGAVYDRGAGNLCANCHQPRRDMVAEDGIVNVSSTHWGPHHGPQSAIMLGVGGVGVEGKPSAHYSMVTEGCPTCHVPDGNHLLAPSLNREAIKSCQACHADAANFDINGAQTEVRELILELEQLLADKHMIETSDHQPYHPGVTGLHPVVGKYPEAEAGALWNWIAIQIEDGSSGVHNPSYIKALLNASIDALK